METMSRKNMGMEWEDKIAEAYRNAMAKKARDDKVLCVRLGSKDRRSMSWFAIDPRRNHDGAAGCVMEIEKMRSPPNLFHDQLSSYGIAVCGTKVYFIGGICMPSRYEPVNDVSIYDTVQGTWSKGPSLIQTRCQPVAVIVFGTKIYVFGTAPWPLVAPINIDHWVECYDSITRQWQTIPGPRDVQYLAFIKMTFAVVHFQDQVRFVGGDDRRLYVFNLSSDSWMQTSDFPGRELPPPDFFNDNHVVYGGFAIWHSYGEAYAWDLTNNKTSFLCKLTDKGGWFQRSRSLYDRPDIVPKLGHLHHLGNGFMCLVYFGICDLATPTVDCYTFQVVGRPLSKGGAYRLGISSIDVRSFDIPHAESMCDAFALSSGTANFPHTGNKETGSKSSAEGLSLDPQSS